MMRRVVSDLTPLACGVLERGVFTHPVYSARVNYITKRHNHRIGLLGIPFNKGQRKLGVCAGPQVLRNSGLVDHLLELGLDVADYGDVTYTPCPDLPSPDGLCNLSDVAPCMYEVSTKARGIQSDGRVCLAVGGDHSCAIGTLDATLASHKEVAVIWVDAHADINMPSTSPTGNVHGMPVAKLARELERYWPRLPGMDWLKPRLNLRNVAYIGLRDVDEYERFIIEKFNITAFSASDVQKHGIVEIMRRVFKAINPTNNKAIHVSFDVDALDPSEAPSTGTPVRGGLTLREGIHIMEEVHRSKRLVALDVMEFNPTIGTPEQVTNTANATLQMVRSALGYRHLRRHPHITELPATTRLASMRSQQ